MFEPQHVTFPSLATAHEWSTPIPSATGSTTPSRRAGTRGGSGANASPQHETFPLLRTAHVVEPPEAMSLASSRFDTRTGVVESLSVPSPSSPCKFLPQHMTWPFERSAHCAATAAEIAT